MRALPMAIADYVAESFETDAVRGAIASRAVQYTSMGPWSAGTTAVLLADSAGNDGGAAGQTTLVRGGPGALAEALASAAQVVRRRDPHRRRGRPVSRRGTTARRASCSATARRSLRERSSRRADPKRTLTTLVDPVEIGPHLRWRAANIRTPGSTSKVNLALRALPAFDGAEAGAARGPDRDRAVDRPPRAGVRRREVRARSARSRTSRRRSPRSPTRHSRPTARTS